MSDVAVAKIALNRPGVVPVAGELEAAGVAEHMGVAGVCAFAMRVPASVVTVSRDYRLARPPAARSPEKHTHEACGVP